MQIDGVQLQTRLNRLGAALRVDGDVGPKTWLALLRYVGGKDIPEDKGLALAKAMLSYLPQYHIDTPLRIAHFLGQAVVETGGFVYLRELWGPTPTQLRYEGRLDLGNTQPGDGRRYLGRGIFQTTGRDNYFRLGKRVGKDYIAHPELLEQPNDAVLSACDFWTVNSLAQWADADDYASMSRAINRGNPRSNKPANHEAERFAATAKCKGVLL